MSDSRWSLYVLRCGDGSLYTGIATDVERRLAEHRGGRGAKYLRGRGPLQLVLRRELGDRGFALSTERRFKQLSADRKRRLIARPPLFDEMLERLFEEWADG